MITFLLGVAVGFIIALLNFISSRSTTSETREANNLPFFMQEPPNITSDDSRPKSNYTNKLNLNKIV